MSRHYNLFVGDLPYDTDDAALYAVFSHLPTLVDAKVMFDPPASGATPTGGAYSLAPMPKPRSKGYGFVAFGDRKDAEYAITHMNGQQVGGRAMRINWGSQHRGTAEGALPPGHTPSMGGSASGMMPHPGTLQLMPPPPGTERLALDHVIMQTPPHAFEVVVHHLPPMCTQDVLVGLVQSVLHASGGGGLVRDCRMGAASMAHIKLDTHANAARIICAMHGAMLGGMMLRCSWSDA
jgi:nucleolysin TIA-1/TIAR